MSKVLIFRLSSLGDLVLSMAALSVPRLSPGREGPLVDWVVSEEFVPLLEGHPGIRRIIPFNRKGGLAAWLELCQRLFQEGYSEVIDLHSSLRTRLARFLFLFGRFLGGSPRLPGERSPSSICGFTECTG